MKVHLKTLGCRLNEAELETWAQAFQKSGHQITCQAEAANLIVINSCAVTQDAARKSRRLIRRTHRDNPQAKLVISGCYATLNQEEAEQLMGVDLIISNKDKDRLVEKTLTELNMDAMPAMSTEPGEFSLFTRGRQRAFVKVQDGCRYRCTFCIVTVARGEEISRPIQAIIDEINTLHRQGINEVILTGVHLGGYGSDLGNNLPDLIKAVLAHTDIPRLRLGSLEPWEFSEDFFELFRNPRCKTEEFAAIVDELRRQIPHFNITTDIIVGFPGETEQEWQESFEFIKQIGFGHIHIFTYSRREGTKAATLPNQLNNDIKKQRSQQLHALAYEMKLKFCRDNVGNKFPVLWEGYNEPYSAGKKLVFGYTPNYLRAGCVINNDESIENQTIECIVTSAEEHGVFAKIAATTRNPVEPIVNPA
jgi:threonylcarbamoyladenosine tRNA methylthiotransferase MtaB